MTGVFLNHFIGGAKNRLGRAVVAVEADNLGVWIVVDKLFKIFTASVLFCKKLDG